MTKSCRELFREPCSRRLSTRKSSIKSHCGIVEGGAYTHLPQYNLHMKVTVFVANEKEHLARLVRFAEYASARKHLGVGIAATF